MNPKLLSGLALALSGAFTFLLAIPSECRGDDPKMVRNDKKPGVDDVRTTVVKIAGLNEPIALTEQPTQFTVQMVIASYRDDEKYTYPKVDELHRQAWLLLADGTSIPQSQMPEVIGTGSGGYIDVHLVFIFQRKSTNEVAGIVVGINGKLYCRELQNDRSKP